MTATAPILVHASVVMIGESGIFIEGPSGSGKSSLAAALLADAAAQQRFGRLVGDDRVSLAAVHGRLVARPHPAIEGLLEHRGLGLVRFAIERAGVVRLAVRLVVHPGERGDRLPGRLPMQDIAGVSLPLLVLAAEDGARQNAARVAAALPLLAGLALSTVQDGAPGGRDDGPPHGT